MSTISETLKRNAYAAAAVLILLSALLPAIALPKFASAALVTSRSIKMSTAKPSTSAIYEIKFTTATAAVLKDVVIDFCDSSPIIGNGTCALPTGMTIGTTLDSQTGLPGTWTTNTLGTPAKTLVVKNTTNVTSVAAGTVVTLTVSGFTNRSAANSTFYGRILTYADDTAAQAYTSGNPGTHVDDGGVAMSTSSQVEVTATVQETLTFCVSAAAPGNNCAGPAPTAPNLTLGHGSPAILDTTAVDTAAVYFQLSTNGTGGTIVNMKTADADLASGTNTIPAAGALNPIVAGTAEFGMRIADSTGGGAETVVGDVEYKHATDYAMVTANVESTYGDPIASATGPVNSENSLMTFAATASNTTAAGVYTASFSLIAVSTY